MEILANCLGFHALVSCHPDLVHVAGCKQQSDCQKNIGDLFFQSLTVCRPSVRVPTLISVTQNLPDRLRAFTEFFGEKRKALCFCGG